MGNHAVGSMYNAALALVSDEEVATLTEAGAMSILDKIHAAIKDDYYWSEDAEFDDMRDPWEKLGKILVKAFCPTRYEEFTSMTEFPEEGDEDWYDAVIEPFRARYGFC